MNIVYSRSNPPCTYCKRVKMVLMSMNIPFEERDINEPQYMEEFLPYGYKTLPLVILNNTVVGGFDQTVEYLNRGE